MASTQPIVLVVVVVCAGGLVFLSLLTFVLFCFFKKRNEKTQETNIIHIDEHKKGKETIVPSHFGKHAVAISVEDDLHVNEARKSEKHGHGLHAKPSSAKANHHKQPIGRNFSWPSSPA